MATDRDGSTKEPAGAAGGLVPSLLVPVLDPGIEPHVGTTDVDVCLSVAIIEGTTGEYEKIQDALRRAGYVPTETS